MLVKAETREAGIKCSLYQPQTLGGLYSVKDRLPSGTQRDVVYSVKCETCQDEYVGETMRALEVRSKEHRDAFRLNHPEKSAVAEHVLERNGSYDIDWTNVRVIDRATGMKERKVREAFLIEQRKPAMNRDKGVEKSRTWNGLFTRQYIAQYTWLTPVSKFAQFVTTNMTIFVINCFWR